MQIMPETARAVGALADDQQESLHDPALNLAIGQRYLLLLEKDADIDGDLLRLLAAYTQGPNNMKRWADAVNDAGDPLLFIEAIPSRRTSAFVQSALLHSWTYALSLHLPAETLDAVASGAHPRLLRASGAQNRVGGNPAVCGPTKATG